ncbi:rab-GTPase-TBC domain-containing protein [Cantharellus anzutake]|uniref:rab-GTPase-TBC domain-containing protein n=1 Tax=Cantharellus anzutake TaxID=1750568 RepID=UPI0019035B32|nr:rab-GTPase-TBC domain-containing protein [Cantharellus anzutake]KAF8336365.1 rab-GTPase-TBC domain-containing protein [Cantharellus anzutake]
MMRPKKRGPGENVETWTPDGQGTTPEKFRQRVWKGISDRWRPAAWQLLIDRLRVGSPEDHGTFTDMSQESIDVPSKHDVQIDLDVPRTVNNHILFHTRYGQGQRSLFHILHCFSLQCSTCEYCQGMGSIAATFLFYLDPERSYVSLVRLHDAYNMHSIFSPGFPGLLENIYVQERLLETLMPGVYQSFKNNVVSSTSYATKWYITLFTNSFPHQMQLRIWDVFLLEGQDIIVLFGIAIIWALKDYLASPQASFESILSLVSSFFVPEDEDAVVSWVHKLSETKGLRSSMSVWRTDWRALVASGKDRTALI